MSHIHPDSLKNRIIFLLDSTCLCGGVKVVFRQVETLQKIGLDACIASPENYPAWTDINIPFCQIALNDISHLKRASHIICTSPLQVMALYEAGIKAGKLWHLCQGYEGDCQEAAPYLEIIKSSYALPVPKMSISSILTKRIRQLTSAPLFTIGQGIEHDIFFPPSKLSFVPPHRIIIIGPFSISVKRIEMGLCIARELKKLIPDLKLVRITVENSQKKEEKIFPGIDEFIVHVPPQKVAETLRKGGILLSTSDSGEGFGLPPVEAMACGVPCILTPIPSFMHYSRPCDYAVFLDSLDPITAAKQIYTFMTDTDKTERVIKRGIEVARCFDFRTVATKIKAALMEFPAI